MEKKLSIPQGIKLKKEIYNGYSRTELIQTSYVMFVAGIISIIIYLVAKDLIICIFFLILIFIITVAMLIKNSTNISAFDQLKFIINFSSGQKKYMYKYEREVKNDRRTSRKNKK